MGKIQTLEAYLAAHDFLNETAAFHFGLAETFADAQPLALPPREKISELVKDGVPLLWQEPFQSQALDATAVLLPAVPRRLTASLLRQESSASTICAALELNEVLTRKTFWAAVDKLVPSALKHWTRDEWHENFCPICGRRPVMAQLKKSNEGRERHLLCGGCRTLWQWRRVGCPYCANDDLERIHILELNDKIRLDVCDACGAYLKTYGGEDEEDIYLRDWTTLHADLLTEEKNFRKCGAVELE